MRRSICLTEPNFALAGEVKTWKFSYTLSSNLPKGTKLKFDLVMQGRPTDWEIPECDPKDGNALIWLAIPGQQPLYPEEIEIPSNYAPAFEFTLPDELKAGEILEFFLGNPSKDPSKGIQAQSVTQRRRPFHLYIDPKGKGDYKDPEIFTIDVRGNALDNIRIFAPSMVSKNRRFDIVVRFEDAFGNLTSNAPEGTLIELTYDFLRESLNWKLFVPETGFIVLPNLYFNEAGIYRIQLKSTSTDTIFYSSPIKCFNDSDYSIYWGLLHGESQKTDSAENIDTFLRQNRDEVGTQFAGTSPFESTIETPNEIWKATCAHVQEYNEENRFTTMLGLQWLGDEGEGLRQIVYWKDNKPLMRKKDSKYTNLKKITKIHSPKEVLVIPEFTMAKGYETDFSDYNPDFERVVEIYNAWGCSECTEKEGNLRPIKSPSGKSINETAEGSIRAALNKNMRFGFVAGGLDDRGIYQPLFESDQVQYSPGLTGIVAIEQTRETLMQALYNRSCYATTGARIVLGLYVAGSQMGTELSTNNKPGLAFNRHITGFVCATAPIKEILIVCNGKELHKIHPKEVTTEFEYDDFRKLDDIALDSPDEQTPFAYYYIRVLQEDGHIAWSSPIWIDFSEATTEEPPAKKTKKKFL
ncbi:MAG: DUF3604 domain-containing protein [Simkaniaceae bacterium]|nr:DUF3604 domain-containing protein [Candidatus Sacchlamyda saccharinae]